MLAGTDMRFRTWRSQPPSRVDTFISLSDTSSTRRSKFIALRDGPRSAEGILEDSLTLTGVEKRRDIVKGAN